MKKIETRYHLKADHPEFNKKKCYRGSEFILVGEHKLQQIGFKKTVSLNKEMFELLIERKYLEEYEYVLPIPKNEDIIAAKGVKIEKSTFDCSPNGGMLDFEVPNGCEAVILMGNKGGGYSPLRYLLPHQIYVNDLREMAEEDGWEVFYILPLVGDKAFPIAYKGEYGKQRWYEK